MGKITVFLFVLLLALLLAACGENPEVGTREVAGEAEASVVEPGYPGPSETPEADLTTAPRPMSTPGTIVEVPDEQPAPGGVGLDELMNSPFMTNYVAQTNPVDVRSAAPENAALAMETSEARTMNALPDGFTPVDSLFSGLPLSINDEDIEVPAVPSNLAPYRFFPQDDPENPNPVWEVPLAGYRDGNNFACESTGGWCSSDIGPYQWRIYTGERLCHPAVGCLVSQHEGQAVSLLIVNLLDSTEDWDVENDTAVFIDSGFSAFGQVWDLSGQSYDVGMAFATLRNHSLYNLGLNEDYPGQCGTTALCDSVLWAVVTRTWDDPSLGIPAMHYRLIDVGVWER